MKELEAVLSKADAKKEQWTQNFHRLSDITGSNKQNFIIDQPLPGSQWTVQEVNVRVLRMFDLLSALRRESSDILLANTMVSEFVASFEALATAVQEVSTQFANIDANGGVGTVASDGFVIASANGGASANFGKLVRNVGNHLDALIPNYYRIAAACSANLAAPPDNLVAEAIRVLKEAEAIAANLRKTQTDLGKQQAEASRFRAEAEAAKNESERLKVEAEQSRKSIGEYEADATQKIANLHAVVSDADKLEKQVKAYQREFEKFQADLAQRNDWFSDAKKGEDELIARLKNKEAEIERINFSAEAMLKGATVAGLASSFGGIRDQITLELNWARRGFYLAVALLFVSVLPLAVYVIPGFNLFGLLQENGSSGEFELGQVLIRALLLLPFAWLAKFAAARHATLFKLREHYAYKYSIASSVEGFKKQAPSLQDEIAAAAFKELTFNPAERMDARVPESEHPNPLIDWIMRKVGATHDGKGL